MFYRWLLTPNYRDDVEADVLPCDMCAQTVGPGSAFQRLTFVSVNGAVWGAAFIRLGGFYFDKNQDAFVPGNEIDLTVTCARSEVASDYRELAFLKKAHRQVFSAHPVASLAGPFKAANAVTESVEESQDQSYRQNESGFI